VVSERVVGAMGKLSRVVLWVCVQIDPSQTRPSLGERVGDRNRSEDGVDTFKGNGCAQCFDHLLDPWKNVVGPELINGQCRTDENRICTLGARGDGENEI